MEHRYLPSLTFTGSIVATKDHPRRSIRGGLHIYERAEKCVLQDHLHRYDGPVGGGISLLPLGFVIADFGSMEPTSAVAPASTYSRVSLSAWTPSQKGMLTGSMTAVIHRASSPARNRTAAPISQPVPSVFRMLRDLRASRASSLMPGEYIMGV